MYTLLWIIYKLLSYFLLTELYNSVLICFLTLFSKKSLCSMYFIDHISAFDSVRKSSLSNCFGRIYNQFHIIKSCIPSLQPLCIPYTNDSTQLFQLLTSIHLKVMVFDLFFCFLFVLLPFTKYTLVKYTDHLIVCFLVFLALQILLK